MTNVAKPDSKIDRQRKALDALLAPTKFSSATRALDLYFRNGIFGRIQQVYERVQQFPAIPQEHTLPLALYAYNQHMMGGSLPPTVERQYCMGYDINSPFTLTVRTDLYMFLDDPVATYNAMKPLTIQRWAEAVALIDDSDRDASFDYELPVY